MKKGVAILFLIGFLMSCNSKPIEKPDDLLEKEQMVAILYDLYLVNAMKNEQAVFLDEHNITPANFILKKYKVDSLQFARSDRYYASDPEAYDKIYQEVTNRLQQDKVKLDSIIAKNPEGALRKPKKKKEALIMSAKDSLKNRGFLTKKILKDSIKN